MTEAEVAANLRPLASGVHVRPSEDELDYTDAQRDTLRFFADAHDELRHRLLPNGSVDLETVDYTESGQSIGVHVIGKDGIPF